MSYHINLRGVIDSNSFWGEEVFTPTMIENELKNAKGEDLIIDIDSVGGCVHSGISIYSKIRRYAKENDATITTRTDGFVASIATIIFLAGDKRVVNEFMQPFVHEPWMWIDSNTVDEAKKDVESLEVTRNILADFYSKHTTLSIDEALLLMKNDTWMDAEYCLSVGFATEIEELSNKDYKLVASLRSKLNKKEMKKNNQNWFNKVANILTNHKTKAQLELADVAGNSVVFPELEEGDVPKEGDKITVGEDANYTGAVETDDYVIETADGLVVTVVDKNETDKDEVISDLVEIIESLEGEVASAKADLKAKNALIASMKSNGNPSDKKERKDYKNPKDESNVSASIAKILERNKNKK